jgi:MFS family permease
MDNNSAYQLGLSLGMYVGGAALIAVYFLPSIVAFIRRHDYRWPIFVVNLIAGWTVIGLIGCFVWAVWPRRQQGIMTREDPPLMRRPPPLR